MTLAQQVVLKSIALKRHEDFHGLTKSFEILWEWFWHWTSKVRSAFEAVAVICYYKIEAEEPLWDVLVADVLKQDPDSDSQSDTKDMVISNGGSDGDE